MSTRCRPNGTYITVLARRAVSATRRRLTAHAPGGRPARPPAVLDDDRRQTPASKTILTY